jgi:DNA primase
MFEFMIRRQFEGFNLETVEGRVGALRAAAPVLADIRDPALRSGYARTVGNWLGMDPAEVVRAVQSAPRSKVPAETVPEQADQAPAEVRLLDLPTDIETRMERDAFLVILQRPQAVGRDLLERAVAVRMRSSILDVVRDGVATAIDAWDRPDWIARVTEAVPAGYAGLVAQLGVAPIPETREANLDRYARAQVADLVAVDLSRRKADLQGASQRAAAEGDTERARRIQVEIAALETERRKLRAG